MRALGDRSWGTRPRAPGLGGVGWFVAEARDGRPDDYVLAGVTDAGQDLVTVPYYLVYGRLALFVQAPVETRSERLTLAAQVQEAAVRAASEGRLPERAPSSS